MTGKSEEMFRPIDLESSLGRIEDAQMNETNDMEMEPLTKTCEQSPFESSFSTMNQDQHCFAPYPIAETDAEIIERQRLGESVGKFLPPLTLQSGRQVDWVPEDLEPADDPGDDDFSLTSAEEESLVEENMEFERIEDPISFWESDFVHVSSDHPQGFASTISFTSHADSSQITRIDHL